MTTLPLLVPAGRKIWHNRSKLQHLGVERENGEKLRHLRRVAWEYFPQAARRSFEMSKRLLIARSSLFLFSLTLGVATALPIYAQRNNSNNRGGSGNGGVRHLSDTATRSNNNRTSSGGMRASQIPGNRGSSVVLPRNGQGLGNSVPGRVVGPSNSGGRVLNNNNNSGKTTIRTTPGGQRTINETGQAINNGRILFDEREQVRPARPQRPTGNSIFNPPPTVPGDGFVPRPPRPPRPFRPNGPIITPVAPNRNPQVLTPVNPGYSPPPTYVPQRVPANSVPANIPPNFNLTDDSSANERPAESQTTATENVSPNVLGLYGADEAQLNDAKNDATDLANENLDELDQKLPPPATDQEKEDFGKELVNSGNFTEEEAKQIVQDLKNGDTESAAQKIQAKDANFDPSQSNIFKRVEVDNQFSDLREAQANGNADDVRQAAENLNKTLKDNSGILKINQGQLDAVTKNTDAAVKLAKTMDVINGSLAAINGGGGNGGGTIPLGGNSILVIFQPDLTPGTVLALGADVNMVGVGDEGELSFCEGTGADFGFPLVDGGSAAESVAEQESEPGTILLRNPAANNGAISYLVNGQSSTLEAGFVQTINAREAELAFDRGGGFGEARYTITAGTYDFEPSAKGWDAFRISFTATMDNSRFNAPFSLVLDNQPVVIEAKQVSQLKSDYPMVVTYDNGSGGEPVMKELSNNTTYTIGINPSNKTWELYQGDADKLLGKGSTIKPIRAKKEKSDRDLVSAPRPVRQGRTKKDGSKKSNLNSTKTSSVLPVAPSPPSNNGRASPNFSGN